MEAVQRGVGGRGCGWNGEWMEVARRQGRRHGWQMGLKPKSEGTDSGAPSHTTMIIVSNAVHLKITREQDFECCSPKEMLNVGGCCGSAKFPNFIIKY